MPFKLIEPREGKSPYWYVRGTHRGIRLDRSTKETTRVAARKWLVKWRDEIDRGEFAVAEEPRFIDAAVTYMAHSGVEAFMQPVIDELGKYRLSQINQALLDQTAVKLKPNGSPATRNRHVYTPVSAVLKHAGHEWKVRRPKGHKGKKAIVWLWPEQAFRLFKAADAVDLEFGLFLRFLCYTGMRLSEALGLTTDRVRLAEGFAYLPDSKNDDPRPIYLPPTLVAALANHPRGMERAGAQVFRFRRGGFLYNYLKKAKKKAGLPQAGFHVMSHTWATWMRRYAGLDVKGLVDTNRWRDEESASRYVHVVPSEEAKKAVLLPTENDAPTRGELVENEPERKKA